MTNLGWIPNLLDNLVNFLDSQLNNILVHPLGLLELFNESILNVRDDLVTKLLRLLRESLLNKETAQNPAETIVDVIDTSSPSVLGGVRILNVLASDSPSHSGSITLP